MYLVYHKDIKNTTMYIQRKLEKERTENAKQAMRLYEELRSIRKVALAMGKSKTWVANAVNKGLSELPTA